MHPNSNSNNLTRFGSARQTDGQANRFSTDPREHLRHPNSESYGRQENLRRSQGFSDGGRGRMRNYGGAAFLQNRRFGEHGHDPVEKRRILSDRRGDPNRRFDGCDSAELLQPSENLLSFLERLETDESDFCDSDDSWMGASKRVRKVRKNNAPPFGRNQHHRREDGRPSLPSRPMRHENGNGPSGRSRDSSDRFQNGSDNRNGRFGSPERNESLCRRPNGNNRSFRAMNDRHGDPMVDSFSNLEIRDDSNGNQRHRDGRQDLEHHQRRRDNTQYNGPRFLQNNRFGGGRGGPESPRHPSDNCFRVSQNNGRIDPRGPPRGFGDRHRSDCQNNRRYGGGFDSQLSDERRRRSPHHSNFHRRPIQDGFGMNGPPSRPMRYEDVNGPPRRFDHRDTDRLHSSDCQSNRCIGGRFDVDDQRRRSPEHNDFERRPMRNEDVDVPPSRDERHRRSQEQNSSERRSINDDFATSGPPSRPIRNKDVDGSPRRFAHRDADTFHRSDCQNNRCIGGRFDSDDQRRRSPEHNDSERRHGPPRRPMRNEDVDGSPRRFTERDAPSYRFQDDRSYGRRFDSEDEDERRRRHCPYDGNWRSEANHPPSFPKPNKSQRHLVGQSETSKISPEEEATLEPMQIKQDKAADDRTMFDKREEQSPKVIKSIADIVNDLASADDDKLKRLVQYVGSVEFKEVAGLF